MTSVWLAAAALLFIAGTLAAGSLPRIDLRIEERILIGAVASVLVGSVATYLIALVAGLNVATDSIAPATRHTARMLASSGITVPRPAKGPASRRSRFRRRFARSSRW